MTGKHLKLMSYRLSLERADHSVVDIDQNKLKPQEAAEQFSQFQRLFDIKGPTEIGENKLIDLPAEHHPYLRRKRRVVVEFIICTLLAADWYSKHMNRSWRFRWMYAAASLALMVALPLISYWIQSVVEKLPAGGAGSTGWAVQVSAIVTGLLAVQKTMATWLDTHRRFGDQWRARAALRDILYGLETRWCGQATSRIPDDPSGPTLFRDDFIAALETATVQARTVIRSEQQRFFDTYSFPTPDILSGLAGAQAGLSGVMKGVQASVASTATGSNAVSGAYEAGATIPPGAAAPNAVVSCGSDTEHFRVLTDSKLGDAGKAFGAALLASAERDLGTLLGWCGQQTFSGLFTIMIRQLPVGAEHGTCSDTSISIGVGVPSPELYDFGRQLVMAEVIEVLSTPLGWNCGNSSGEALSRVLASAIYPGVLPSDFLTANAWLNSTRPDFVNQTCDSDTEHLSVGCAVLFLNWLHFQLQKPWPQIVGAARDNLAGTYAALGESGDAFKKFSDFVARYYPPGTTARLTSDNPFPLSVRTV